METLKLTMVNLTLDTADFWRQKFCGSLSRYITILALRRVLIRYYMLSSDSYHFHWFLFNWPFCTDTWLSQVFSDFLWEPLGLTKRYFTDRTCFLNSTNSHCTEGVVLHLLTILSDALSFKGGINISQCWALLVWVQCTYLMMYQMFGRRFYVGVNIFRRFPGVQLS